MDQNTRNLHVARIINSDMLIIINKKTYTLKSPSRAERYRAELVYGQALEEAQELGLFRQSDMRQFLVDNLLWSKESDQKLENIEKDLDNLKVELFERRNDKPMSKRIREHIVIAEDAIADLHRRRHQFDHLTCEGAAHSAKQRYLIASCLYHRDRRVIGWEKPTNLLNVVMDYISSNTINNSEMREIARTEPWQSYWNARHGESGLFGAPACDLTNEQLNLISISTFYDNVRQNPDLPIEIIDDDYILDGWLILQRRKHDKDMKRRAVESRIPDHIAGCSEVFVTPEYAEEVEIIDDMNDVGAKIAKARNMGAIREKGVVRELDLPANRDKIQMMINQMSH